MPGDKEFFDYIGKALGWNGEGDYVLVMTLPTTGSFLIYWLLCVENSPTILLDDKMEVRVRDNVVNVSLITDMDDEVNEYTFDTLAYIYDKLEESPHIEGRRTLEELAPSSTVMR